MIFSFSVQILLLSISSPHSETEYTSPGSLCNKNSTRDKITSAFAIWSSMTLPYMNPCLIASMLSSFAVATIELCYL
jgi:hypothetical protein